MKVVQDNVLGPLEIDTGLIQVIDTPLFQRLRRLEQLGTASLVFPGARHTRFEHSLGAQEIMRRALQRLRGTPEGSMISCRDEKLLRVSALVHDIGHYPLSHITEHVLHLIGARHSRDDTDFGMLHQPAESAHDPLPEIDNEERWLQIAASSAKVPHSSPAHHESLTTFLLQKDENLQSAIDAYIDRPGAFMEVISILQKDNVDKYKHQLLSSELDVDRLDYLVRDSYYTGVTFGTIEVDHLIRRMCLASYPGSEEKFVAVEERARPHVEHYLLARHFMYSQIIYHKAVTAFSALAAAVWIALYNLDTPKTDFPSIRQAVADAEFQGFDDTWFWQQAAALSASPQSFSSRLATDLLCRRPPVQVLEERRRADQALDEAKMTFESNKSDLARDSGLLVRDLFFTEHTIQMPNEPTAKDYVKTIERGDKYLPEELLDTPDELPHIKRQSGDAVPITAIPGSIVQRLSGRQNREKIVRVYCLRPQNGDSDEFMGKVRKLEKMCREAFCC